MPEVPAGSRVLDIGCGTGDTLFNAMFRDYDVVGIDISRSAVERVKERARSRGLSAEVHVADVLEGLERFGSFDMVLFHHVLDSLTAEDRRKAVANARKVLRSGGVVSFQDLSVNDMRFGRGEMVEEGTYLKGNGLACHFFTLGEVQELFFGYKVRSLDEVTHHQRTKEGKLARANIIAVFERQ